jgi:hypothetical protein
MKFICISRFQTRIRQKRKPGKDIHRENTEIERHEIFLFFEVFVCPIGRNYRTGVNSGFRDIKRLFHLRMAINKIGRRNEI